MAEYDFIDATGTTIVDTADTQTEVEDEYKALFGADLIVKSESPEGLLIGAEVQSRDGIARNNANLANQINPNLSEGIFLDAILNLTGTKRLEGLPSLFAIEPTITGVAGTLIPAGSQAKTISGDIFETTESVTIDVSGIDTVQFQSVENGPIQVGIGDLSIIIDAILGWETINNTVEATPGRLQESDQAARLRRRETLALQGKSVSEAIFSRVRDVDGVVSLAFRQNASSSSNTIDGILMDANSIFVSVQGGTDVDVATALLESKSDGCGWNGNTTVNVVDELTGQSYSVEFERPAPVPMLASVTVNTGSSVVDPEKAVKDAIVKYANGEIEGESGFTVGGDVSPFELSGAINAENPELFVREVLIDTVASGSPSTAVVAIGLDEFATIIAANISVTVV